MKIVPECFYIGDFKEWIIKAVWKGSDGNCGFILFSEPATMLR